MAKTTQSTKAERTNASAENTGGTAAGDAMEQRVVAFAEQLGWLVGTVQSRTEGWMDRATLSKQLTSVRDGAAALLRQMKSGLAEEPKARVARVRVNGRSGGMVDAPGKKHRKPLPADPGRAAARSQTAKLREALPMAKTTKRRGRG